MIEWRKIDGKPNYSVSNDGQIRNDKTGRILKLHEHRCGYLQVMLGRKTVPVYVHRAVAIAFIPNPEGKKQVDHINGNKKDNRVENLRWVSPSENCSNFGHRERIENRKKKVVAIKDDQRLEFESRDACAAYFNSDKANIKYGHTYEVGSKSGWTFYLAKDIV